MRLAISTITGAIVGRYLWLKGCEIARWCDADQIDYVFLPLLATLIPYAAAVTIVVVAVGNGWIDRGSKS